jgi:hypothetical protein
MGPFGVVNPSEFFDVKAGVEARREPALVEAFVPEPAVEAIDVRVLHRLAGLAWT